MPRQPRIDLPGVPQHLVQRGNDRRPCFFAPIDRTRYLDELRDAACRHGCAVHAYVLMTNHVYLLLTPARTGCVSTMMQSLGRRYVRYINDRYRRTGTLWECRFKACPVQSDDPLLGCYPYTELKPVRARRVSQASDCAWSSYAANAQGATDPLVCAPAVPGGACRRHCAPTPLARLGPIGNHAGRSRRDQATPAVPACFRNGALPTDDRGATAAPSRARKDRPASEVSASGACGRALIVFSLHARSRETAPY